MLSDYEYASVGVQWTNMWDGVFSFGSCLGMMWVDFWLYLFLAWYLEHVLPSEYGQQEHPLFFLLPSYWLGGGAARPPRSARTSLSEASGFWAMLTGSPQILSPTMSSRHLALHVEDAPDARKHPARVLLKDLVKRYDDGNVAVQGLNLTLFEGQVTCLLGHNGAGTPVGLVCALMGCQMNGVTHASYLSPSLFRQDHHTLDPDGLVPSDRG